MNPFYALQKRLQTLIAANEFFAGLQETQILTEEVGDLEYVVNNSILPLGFGVVITTAVGRSQEAEYNALLSMEDLNVSVTNNPTTDPKHYALDAVWAVMQAIQGQPVTLPAPPAGRPYDFFSVSGHQRRADAPPGCHVHEVHVKIGARLM